MSIHISRFYDYRIGCFDRDFISIKLDFGAHQGLSNFGAPLKFEKMVSLAEKIASDSNFIRVELYSIDNSVVLNELTPYPGAVSAKFLPESIDEILGAKW